MIKRILVPLDGSEYMPSAIEYAVEIAKEHGASVTGLGIVDVEAISVSMGPAPIGAAEFGDRAIKARTERRITEIESWLADFANACGRAKVAHTDLEEEGVTSDRILEDSRSHDLVVMGLKGHFRFDERGKNTSRTLWKLLHDESCPVLAVPKTHRRVKRVVTAQDGSTAASKALQIFLGMGLWPDAEVTMVHVGERAVEAVPPLIRKSFDYLRAYRPGAKLEMLPDEEAGLPAHKAVPEFVRENGADLAVLGTHNRSKASMFFFGSVASALIREELCPVFFHR